MLTLQTAIEAETCSPDKDEEHLDILNEGSSSRVGRKINTISYNTKDNFIIFIVRLVFRARPSKICTPYYVNATFPCEVTGYPQPKISWYKNAREITNNNKALRKGNSLIITSAWGKDEGIYQCIVSNGLETIHQAASLIVGGSCTSY